MPTASQAKHKFCRRIGQCLWGDPKCPSVKRPYPAGPHGKGRRGKLSTYGELQLEKQKLRYYYAISEKQLQIAYAKAKMGSGQTHEKLFRSLEQRL
ncbi:MAG: 30S ribosomal protein S4, partial [Lentisphaeria bacterium]|nr:30S ribosomal protein S4 [Lentisphaeria bacterium]